VDHPSLSLIVLRTPDLERAVDFYEHLGLEFVREQHGAGPVHYSAQLGRVVLELYPCAGKVERGGPADVRVGLEVDSIADVLEQLDSEASDSADKRAGSPVVVRDPDGRAVELREHSSPRTESVLIDDPPDLAAVEWLLDVDQPAGDPMSCIAASLREGRALTTPGHEMTWTGALACLIFVEQIGTCFSLDGMATTGKGPLEAGLRQFGQVWASDAPWVRKLRNRLAHDFTLADESERIRLTLDDDPDRLVSQANGHATVSLVAIRKTADLVHQEVLRHLRAGTLRCHYPGGVAAVTRRFVMSFGISPQ